MKNVEDYWEFENYGDKELKSKNFKLKFAYLSNIIDEKLFEQIFGQAFETLAIKLINTKNKAENQIIVRNIGKNKKKNIMWSNCQVDVLI